MKTININNDCPWLTNGKVAENCVKVLENATKWVPDQYIVADVDDAIRTLEELLAQAKAIRAGF